jgi:hypothetical protein
MSFTTSSSSISPSSGPRAGTTGSGFTGTNPHNPGSKSWLPLLSLSSLKINSPSAILHTLALAVPIDRSLAMEDPLVSNTVFLEAIFVLDEPLDTTAFVAEDIFAFFAPPPVPLAGATRCFLFATTLPHDVRGVVVVVVVQGSVGARGWLNEWGCLWGQYER